MKKKLLSVLLSVAMVATLLVGCGETAATTEEATTEEATTEVAATEEVAEEEAATEEVAATDEAITVGVVQTNANESDWRTANTKSFNEAFAEAGFEIKMVFGEGDHAKQISQAQQLIQEEVDYLVVLGLQSAGWEDVAKAAKEAVL